MAGKDPSMPFYVNDWLSSARVQTMSPLQELAYFRLCLFCWSSQDASLPDDDDQLMRMAKWQLKGGSRVVENGWPLVRDCFQPHPSKVGYLTNERVLELWVERQEWREKSRIGGKNSAANRSRKRGYGRSKGGSTTVPTNGQPKGNSSSSSSSSSSNPSLSPLAVGEREVLIGLVAKQKVHQAESAVDGALARGCTADQITEAARIVEGKALFTLIGSLRPPSEKSKGHKASESREDKRLRMIRENDVAGVSRAETNQQLLSAGLEGVFVPQQEVQA
jgi:hypothetical protein